MGEREGGYGCMRGPIMGFELRAISARVTKQIVTIFSKTCDKDRANSVDLDHTALRYNVMFLYHHNIHLSPASLLSIVTMFCYLYL